MSGHRIVTAHLTVAAHVVLGEPMVTINSDGEPLLSAPPAGARELGMALLDVAALLEDMEDES